MRGRVDFDGEQRRGAQHRGAADRRRSGRGESRHSWRLKMDTSPRKHRAGSAGNGGDRNGLMHGLKP